MDVEQWVWYYYKEGINIVPAYRGEKLPKVNWKKYETEFVSEEVQKKWLLDKKYENIFAILGSISNNTAEIDIDVPNIKLEDIFDDVGEAKKKLWIAESSMGRKKIYCRGHDIKGSDNQVVSDKKYKMPNDKDTLPHVEYRGHKHGSILPPSIHYSGAQYKWLNLDKDGKLPNLETIETTKLYNKIVKRLREKYNYNVPYKAKSDGSAVKKRRGRPRYCFVMSHDNGDKWDGTTGHSFRVAVVNELLNKNYSDDDIYDFFKTHDETSGEEFNIKITEKQIAFAKKSKQHKWFCQTLQDKCGDIIDQYCKTCPLNKPKDETLYVSYFDLPDGKYLEEIVKDGVECFILYDKKTGEHEIVKEYMYGDVPIRPYEISTNMKNAVIMPDGIEEYGTLGELLKEMHDFALEEYDPVDYPELYELTIDLFLTSWISPVWQKNMAEKFIPIVNPRGPSETGKKRFLTIARWLTYHSIYALKTLRVPTLFRATATLDGTLILDEADMNDSTLSNELVEFLNSRCDGVPIPRYSKDSNEVEWWNSFGMTVMATRQGFSDDGLESRCTVMPTSTTDNPEKYNLIPPNEWLEKGKRLQRKLLMFKLRHLDGKMPTQLTIPNVSSFRVREALLIMEGLKHEDPNLLKKVMKLAVALQERIIKERAASPEGLILNIVHNFICDENAEFENDGIGHIVYKMKQNKEGEKYTVVLTLRTIHKSLGEAFSSSQIAKMWRGFNQDTFSQKRIDGKKYRGVILIKHLYRLDKVFSKYVPNYITPSKIACEFGGKHGGEQTNFGET